MAAGPVDLPPPNTAAEAKSSPQTGLLSQTASFATSQLAALTAFFGAIAAAYLSFQKLQSGLGLSVPLCVALVTILLALLFFSHTLPTLLERRRKNRLAEVTGSTKPGYFQLAVREDEAAFQRADGKQDEVLRWLQRTPAHVLYLTGSSGAGKSSLLAAWVLPKLDREGVKVIRLRGYQNPARALEDELKRPGAIWKRNPPDTTDLNALFEEARQRVQPSRILVVFDQFEEFLILQEEQQRARFVEFLTAQATLRETRSAILLVFRAEYDGFVQDLNLPAPIPGQNLQKVSAFTQRAAQDFLLGSGRQIQPQLLADVLREAAEIEETKGLIRPVTLNLCGLVLARFATGLPHAFRPGRLIRGFVHESVFQKDVREASPILLPKLISQQGTKQPLAVEDLARGTSLSPRQAQGVMFKLGDPERGIVHALDPEYRMWEISHDFLVPMINSMLVQWRVSLWRKVRPWLPLGYVAVLLIALFVVPRLIPDPISELNKMHWQTRLVDANNPKDAKLAKNGDKYLLTFNSVPPPESLRFLKRIPGPFAVKLTGIQSFDKVHFGAWAGLTNLTALGLDFTAGFEDISAAKDLLHVTIFEPSLMFEFTDADLGNLPPSLASFELLSSEVTDAGLKALPRSLTSLVLYSENITDAGIGGLPRSLTSLDLGPEVLISDEGLKALPRSLTSFSFQNAQLITDARLKDLPPSLESFDVRYGVQITDAGYKDLPRSLTSLHLEKDVRITDAGLKDLPRSLASLELNAEGSQITDAGVKDLPKSLTSLDFGDGAGAKITDLGLKDLPKSLTSLDLKYDRQITDAGLKDLPRSLTSLNLQHDDKITDAGLQDLPRSLTSLDLSFCRQITDVGLKDMPRSLTELNLSSDPNITDAGLKDLPKSLTTLNLGYDPKITDAGLKELPPSLTSLHLVSDDKITNAGIKNLPSGVNVDR